MARVVEEAVIGFGDQVTYTKVITKTLEGANRYKELIKLNKTLLPIPSIIINEQLAFKMIPGKEELVDRLNAIVSQPQIKGKNTPCTKS